MITTLGTTRYISKPRPGKKKRSAPHAGIDRYPNPVYEQAPNLCPTWRPISLEPLPPSLPRSLPPSLSPFLHPPPSLPHPKLSHFGRLQLSFIIATEHKIGIRVLNFSYNHAAGRLGEASFPPTAVPPPTVHQSSVLSIYPCMYTRTDPRVYESGNPYNITLHNTLPRFTHTQSYNKSVTPSK